MAKFTETIIKTVNCPACESKRVMKMGKRNGEQRYLCRRCRKSFFMKRSAPAAAATKTQKGGALHERPACS